MICEAQVISNTDTTIRFNNSIIKKKKKKHVGEESTIKIAPIGFVSGTFPIFFERVINDFFTIQCGIGFTGKNYIRELSMQVSEYDDYKYPWVDDGSYSDQATRIYDFDSRKPVAGWMVNLQPRLYFDSDAPAGGYFGADLSFYRYNFNMPGIVYSTQAGYAHTGNLFKEHENMLDLMGYWGYQSVFDRLSIDYSVGLGLRKIKGEKYAYGVSNIGTSNIEGMANYSKNTFNFNIGLRIGYHF